MVTEIRNYAPNIMIATIDPEISDVLAILLKNLNYKIQLINSSSGAIEKIKEKQYDLILLDASLPGMNVSQILYYIKENCPDALIIILAGFSSNDNIAEYMSQGAYDILNKPFEKEEIMRRIKNALNQKKLKDELLSSKEKLNAMEKRYEYIAQNSIDLIYTLDSNGNFTYVNESIKHILGFDKEQLVKKHYSAIMYPDDIEKAKFIFNERRTVSRDSRIIKLRLKKYSGNSGDLRYTTVELKARGIYDKAANEKDKIFLGTHGIVRDISNNIQLEESLRLQKVYFRQLFSNIPEAIAIVDSQNNVIEINKGFEKLFFYENSEIKNSNINKLIVPKKLTAEIRPITPSTQSGAAFEIESVRIRKDGQPLNVSILICPIAYNNRIIASYHMYKDKAELIGTEIELEMTLKKLRKAMGGIINAMVSTVEVRDPYTAGHQQRVADLARAIAREMGLPEDEIDGIRMAGTLHDLGKVNIPAEILSKPGRLSEIEFSLIKMHPRVAFDILKEIDFPWPVAVTVYQHHERLDGSGYPQGLFGKDILLSSKILTVADVVEAIESHRPYRPALGIKKALDEINLKKGVHYDPEVVDACIRLFEEKRFEFPEEIKEKHEPINLNF